MTPWAGEGYGARFLPRIGEIVVIDFFDGNIDRPFVLGRIHEAYRVPTQFDSKGQLPDTKKLSGIRSQEVGGDGFGQLRFDDTTGQISTQLQSSHGATQLNLGNLSHPKDTEQSEGRGEGFELRTDQWGAVRAGQGMLITTYAQHNALAEHLEATQEQALLVQGQENMKMLSEIAVKQQTDALNVVNRLPKFIQSLQLNTKNQALNATLNLFKQGLASDPLNVLKDCGGFIQDIGTFGGGVQDIVDSFNRYFSNAPEAMNNLQSFMENIGNSSSQSIKDKVLAFKDQISNDPFLALQNVGSLISSVDLSALNGSSGTSNIAPMDTLSSLQNFMEGQTQNLEASDDPEKQEQGKIFRQALMLLASPNGIALTTPEDILLNAVQDIAQAAQGSINLSAQKNIITHALDKISLFAAQKGIDIFAGKEKIKIQAQDDAIEAIARKVIQIISTEDKIELTSAKEIDMKAGGSQLIINSRGVFIKTNGLFESKAGQHSFVNGIKVPYEVPQLPNTPIFSNRLDVYDIFWQSDFSKLSYKAFIPDNNSFLSGQIDEHGRTGKINTADPSKVKLLVGEDGEWGVSIEAYDISEFDEELMTMQDDNQLNNDEFNG